jgi:predicted nucleic acid-binding protein
MILVDTSVWVSHLRWSDNKLKAMLEDEKVLCHPFIVGELACGTIRNRDEVLTLLQALPRAKTATDDEVLRFIDLNRMMGMGLGFIDMHLLVSALLSHAALWTTDKRLRKASATFGALYYST